MAERKAREMREMTVEELSNQVLRSKQDLMKMRFQLATGQLADTAKIEKKKKEIARFLTVIRQKELRG
jgi:large subunit ribosomal protein L29